MNRVHRLAAILFVCAVGTQTFAASSASPRKTSLNLGDSTADLVFTPLAPCRIIDTRTGGGFISAGATRNFFVAGSTGFNTQGGNAAGCGVPATATAVLINFVAVNPQGLGNLKGAAYPNPIPTTGSIINYNSMNPALNIANGIAFPICDHSAATCTFDISLFANAAGTDVVADVLGYFKRFPTEQTITSIVPGSGLIGGGTSGVVSLGIDTTGAATNQALTFNGTTTAWQTMVKSVTAGPGVIMSGSATDPVVNADLAPSSAFNGSATSVARSDHKHYLRTVIVSPVVGGTTLQNGTALLNALAGMSGSAAAPLLLKIEPGVYDVGSTVLNVQPYIDIEGSGIASTKITRSASLSQPVVFANGSNLTEIRDLTIDGNVANFTGVLTISGPFAARRVAVNATGPYAVAIYISAGPALIEDSTIVANGGGCYGMIADGSGLTSTLRRVVVNASANTASMSDWVVGIANSMGTLDGDSLAVTATSTGAPYAIGIESAFSPSSNLILTNSRITASATSSSTEAFGIWVNDSAFSGRNNIVTSSCAGPCSSIGVSEDSASVAHTVTMRAFDITSVGATVAIIGANYTTRISNSTLAGAPVTGTATCTFNVDENGTGFAATCP